jgi:hypothetical protein
MSPKYSSKASSPISICAGQNSPTDDPAVQDLAGTDPQGEPITTEEAGGFGALNS